MNVVIMGCGRVGARLARMFDREGHSVSVVDMNPQAFEKLDIDFKGRTVVGTGIDEDVLKRAGIEQADIFLAVTNLDNPNIMASQIAQLLFKVPRVIARIYDPAREDTYHDLGLETICPTTLISQRIYEAVSTDSTAPLEDREVEPVGQGAVRPGGNGVTPGAAGNAGTGITGGQAGAALPVPGAPGINAVSASGAAVTPPAARPGTGDSQNAEHAPSGTLRRFFR